MFQLLMPSSTQALSAGEGSSGMTGSGSSLVSLLRGVDMDATGFGAELHAMLMQLSPQLLQRLDELLAGGNSLPQAANQLLDETLADGVDEPFAGLLKQFAGLGEADSDSVLPRMPNINMPVDGTLARNLPAVNVALGESASAPAALIANALAGPTTGPNATTLSPQLASNLLDMGVPQQVGSRTWGGEVAERVMWMVQGEQQFARLKLNPPQLGPLEVRVSVNQDQAQVAFLAQHAAVREALEAALPRLREMFDQSSLQLVRADVGDPGAERGDQAGTSNGAESDRQGTRLGGDADADVVAEGPASVIARGLVDLFA